MKIYKNPWVTRESYFVKTGAAKSAKMEAAKSAGYSVDFWNGKWIVRKAEYYNKSLAEMPVVIENRTNIQAIIDRAILSAVLDLVGEVNMNCVKTAKEMDIHHNSVIYRLGKIKTETGLDARKFWDLVKLLEMEES